MRRLTHRVRRLDRELADGCDPDRDRHRARRARKIVGADFRRRLAGRLEQLVREAESSPPWQSSVHWPEVRELAIPILVLADSLAAPIQVSPQGVAQAALLLEDGAGALYGPGPDGALAVAVRSALRSLEVGPLLDEQRRVAPRSAPLLPMPWGI